MPVVYWKELQDHFSSLRFMILLALIMLPGVLSVYLSGQAIQEAVQTSPTEHVFLRLLTTESFFFSLSTFLGFFGPLVGITLGFDSISGEYGRGTLSRVLSQPIYRDSLINGKFLAGLTTLAILWVSILLVVLGLGITLIGFLPDGEELWRMLFFAIIGITYTGFWLALAMLLSMLLRKTVTAALASIALWLFLGIFIGVLSGFLAGLIVPNPQSAADVTRLATVETVLGRMSPSLLYTESVRLLLNPVARSVVPVLQEQLQGLIIAPLNIGQSLRLILPMYFTLVALVATCFGIAYIKFMRTEIRG
jgi:ABC-2 type transport system permease protein